MRLSKCCLNIAALVLLSILFLAQNYQCKTVDDNEKQRSSSPLLLSELLLDVNEDNNYFNKYPPCSVAANKLYDAYKLEKKLSIKILSGFDFVFQDKKDKKHFQTLGDLDEKVKKILTSILEEREGENSTIPFMRHPLNAYHFIKRIITKFNPIFNTIFSSNEYMKRTFFQELKIIVDKYIRDESNCWPTVRDMKMAVTGLSQIFKTYDIPITDVMQGKVQQATSAKKLSLSDAIVFNQESNRLSYFLQVLKWTEYIEAHYLEEINNNEQLWRSVTRMKAAALLKVNKVNEAIKYLENAISSNKYDTRLLKKDINYYKSKENAAMDEETKKKFEEDKLVDKLCRNAQINKLPNRYKCFYRPVKVWNQYKVELMNKVPLVYKYYNVISGKESLYIMGYIKSEMTNNQLYKGKLSSESDMKLRKESSIVWDEDIRTTTYLSKRISYITSLSTMNYRLTYFKSSSGPFKVTNYGLGGHSEKTVDYLKLKNALIGGDRIATWLFQMNTYSGGGNLVFPKLNLGVKLEKGTGIMWFNLFRNGTFNPKSEHLECPVVDGSKWTAEKHILENGNIFRRKCPKNKGSYF